MAAFQATVASLQATVAAQATTNAELVARLATLEATPNPTPGPTAAPTATPSASPTSVACEGVSTIHSDAELAAALPVTRMCGSIIGNLWIYGVSNETLLAEAFPNLRVVTDTLLIHNNPHLISVDGSFPQLQTVGGNLIVDTNPTLASLDGTLQNLQSVGGNVNINSNPLLTSVGSAFGNMRSVGGYLYWAHNGQTSNARTAGSVAFCASARGALCPTTTTYDYGNCKDLDTARSIRNPLV